MKCMYVIYIILFIHSMYFKNLNANVNLHLTTTDQSVHIIMRKWTESRLMKGAWFMSSRYFRGIPVDWNSRKRREGGANEFNQSLGTTLFTSNKTRSLHALLFYWESAHFIITWGVIALIRTCFRFTLLWLIGPIVWTILWTFTLVYK